jgi:hypothetical protein
MNGNTPAQGLQSAPPVPAPVTLPGANLLVQLTPNLRRDVREELLDLSLRGDHRSKLDERARQEGLEFHDERRVNDYTPKQGRAFTVLRGPNVEVVLFQIEDWIARDGGYIGALTEAAYAFKGSHIRILSVGVEVAADGLDTLCRQWKQDLQIEAQFVPWPHVADIGRGRYSIASVFGVVSPRPQQEASAKGVQVFISYSHMDSKWLERLLRMLKPLERRFPTAFWNDKKIDAGVRWAPDIEQALASARVVILLVSANFLNSDFVHEHELGPVLTAARTGQKKILWVLLSDCLWEQTDIQHYQAAHDIKRPIAELPRPKQEAQLKIVAKMVLTALESS